MGNKNSGRRPEPTALTILRGNPSRKPLNTREPIPPPGPVTKPIGLSPIAAAVWDVLAPVALAMRTLTTADVFAFVTLCELQATFNQIQIEKAAAGYAPARRASRKAHPLVRLERDTAAALRPYYDAFGLQPAARSRLVVPGAPAPVSKWA